jgi:ubiquinone/menaquinone biosynthesis C-methylase UbiE
MKDWTQKRSIQNRYDLTADKYEERYAQEQEAKYMKALAGMCLNSESFVLDVGCGSGLFFRYVASKVAAVVGVDISRGLLIKANVQAKKHVNAHVVLADADHLPLVDGFFTGVFAFTILQNMPKPKQTLLELKRAIKVGGCMVVSGLKKAFELTAFLDLFEASSLVLSCFLDEASLNCYLAFGAKS